MALDPLHHLCLRQGFFLRGQALALGATDAELRRSVRAKALVRVRQGAYVFADLWPAEPEARHLVVLRAVLQKQGGRVAASHHSAALVHGMDLWDVPLEQTHVTRLDAGSGRTEAGVDHHQGLILPEDVVEVAGLAVVKPVRAALESASLLDTERGLVTVDSGLRLGLFTPDELQQQVTLMQSWPDSLKLQLVTRLADGRSESVGESRTRHLLWAAGIPAPELQYPVRVRGTLLGVADFAWPGHRLLGEFDGRMKYTRYARPGEEPGDVVFREKQREDRLRAAGWKIVRITWSMLQRPQDTAAHVRSQLYAAA